ncbi:MAG TPA: hypothetical protein VL993_12015 [Stellaceae bacterium]|nr:hypothetical protein [Stellaceae bacterium]
MFREITIDEPIHKIIDDWDFFEDKVVGKFSTFRPIGQNIFGIRRRAISRTEIIDPRKGNVSGALELGPTGIALVPHRPLEVHVTTGGTPHRVKHSFGFWHVNDMDELYLPLPNEAGDPLGHMVVIQEAPVGNEGESFAWYCETCLTMLWELRYPTGAEGFQGFWKAEERAVRLYNSDPKHRLCPECGHVNPMGYCWNKAKDTEEERAARAIW